jgi:hypothetical protein
MSADALPITADRFAAALADLPLSSLYAKAVELRNSIAHLQRSNAELQAHLDGLPSGQRDRDCEEAITENVVVIERMRERVGLLTVEVERRGGRWHEAQAGEEEADESRKESSVNGINGSVAHGEEMEEAGENTNASNSAARRPGGSLSDAELQRRLLDRTGEDEEDGMHL